MLKKILKILLIISFPINTLFAADIPIIVIAPSKKAQSKSVVGTNVTVFTNSEIEKSNDYFLGDILGAGSTSMNYFQSGGYGTASAIQLRGLPKRYSTVYIDGVKQSDPSSVSGDFDFNHILKNQISRVEILKGNQSSVYGSGAIGGTINIITKRGEPGFQKKVNYNTSSNSTHNLALSMSGADEKNDFYFGLERFFTAGISAMNNNDEDDGYKNNTIVANYGYKFSDILKLENNIRYGDTYLQYDTTNDWDSFTKVKLKDNPYETSKYLSGSASLIYKPNSQFTNNLTYSGYSIDRKYNTNLDKQDEYDGRRKGLTYNATYNINLDSSVTFGAGSEYDRIYYNKGNKDTIRSEGFQTNSSYIDYQKRFTNNIYATLGARLDEHSLVGKENSQRATVAYLFDDKTTKLKASAGTGFRFPSLYEAYYAYGALPKSRKTLKAETSKGFDLGLEKSFTDLGLNIDLSYFNTKYIDALEGWQGNTLTDVWGSVTLNNPSTTKSQGIEFLSKLKFNEALNFDLNYTYTSTYDGAEHDNPQKNSDLKDTQMVRVPKHFINLTSKYIFPNKNLNVALRTKVSSKAWDYGHVQTYDFEDQKLNSYMVNDLALNYNLWGMYDLYFDINNIFDKKYSTVLQYGALDRSFNFGIKRVY